MLKSLILLSCALLLVACMHSVNSTCPGWIKPPNPNDPLELAYKEQELSRWIIATDRFGQAQKCW